MKTYSDASGKSGVNAYEVGDDFIIVQFTTGAKYLYDYATTGSFHVHSMVRMARAGSGLNGYINTNTKYLYARKLA